MTDRRTDMSNNNIPELSLESAGIKMVSEIDIFIFNYQKILCNFNKHSAVELLKK